MQVGILGPLEVRDGGDRAIEVAGSRLRTLLVRLALSPSRPVGVGSLVAEVWGEQPPADEANALQTLVSRLRRALGDVGLVVRSAAGYTLTIGPDDVDSHRFEHLAAAGAAALRAGDPTTAAALLRDALALWRSDELAEQDTPAIAAYATRLRDLRLAAMLDRAEADLAADPSAGRAAGVVVELEALAGGHPLNERLTGHLMAALAATGQQAEALRRFEQLRARLADELGVDPSAELRNIQLAVLRGKTAAADAPPRPARRTNVRAQFTSFVGRDDEVARIAKSLEESRLVTLVGPGGAGKTRLASEAATRIVDGVPDGVWLVELASVTDAADVPRAVLGSLGMREVAVLDRTTQRTGSDAVSRLLEGLADKRAVLVLDNCEHLVDAAANLADLLLARCPRLRILTTSREPFAIFGEVLLAVPPLAQPDPRASAVEALAFPAVRLFADRAAAVRADFAVDETTVAPVVEIVRRLDGLPLAIELAAARLRTLPLTEIAARLSDRFRLLTAGSRTALPRHRTLRAVVEWSWDLLTGPERRLAERLAVFPSGTTTASAAAVCAGDEVDARDIPDLLASLLDKSLLQPAAGGTRQRMLETIREYGLERLAERGELVGLRDRHARYFGDLLATAEPHLRQADQLVWLAVLNAERDNILGALRFRCDQRDADAALRIAVGLSTMAMLLGSHSDLGSWISEALAVPGSATSPLRVIGEALSAINTTTGVPPSSDGGDVEPADLRRIARRLDAVDLTGHPMIAILKPALAMFSGDAELTERYIAEARTGGDRWAAAAVLMFRANLAENEGDLGGLRTDAAAALVEFRAIGERWGIANSLRTLAQVYTLDGDLDAAGAAYSEALALMDEMGSQEDASLLQVRLADLAVRRGDLAAARRHLAAARASSDASGSALEAVLSLCAQAEMERHLGTLEVANALYAEALRRYDAIPPAHPVQNHAVTLVTGIGARLLLAEGDLAGARDRAQEAYEAALTTRDKPIIALIGVMIAAVAARAGHLVEAAEILGACAQLRGSDDWTGPEVVEVSGPVRTELGEAGFADAYGRGRGMSRAEASARLDPSRLPAL